MTSLVFYFQVHQPFRLRHFSFFDIGSGESWFDDGSNDFIVRRVAEKCYLPMNALMLRRIEELEGRFRIAYSISGTALEQFERWSPETLESFQALARTGCVEFLSETSHHSLAFLDAPDEFERQVRTHTDRIEALFGARPTVFRNTECVISNDVAQAVERMGFDGLIGEGADRLLGWRSPRHIYRPTGCERLKLLLRDYEFSDDIAFRFSNKEWDQWPLTADRYAAWLRKAQPQDAFVGLFMDYETFGEHQWAETGIFDFMERLPDEVLEEGGALTFETPGELCRRLEPPSKIDLAEPVSWADAERDLSAWLGNPMQKAAHAALYALAAEAAATGDEELIEAWRKLSTSDHVYYMSTKWFSDGDVHEYFSPYETPHDAFISFMNVVDDLARRVEDARSGKRLTPAPKPPRKPSKKPPRKKRSR